MSMYSKATYKESSKNGGDESVYPIYNLLVKVFKQLKQPVTILKHKK